jgi:hypothetical protein
MGILTDRFGGRAVFSILMAAVVLPVWIVPQQPTYSSLLTVAFLLGLTTGDLRRWGARRVEEGRVTGGLLAAGCFPSPLIKPDVPVSSIRLSDRLHQLAHGSGPKCTSRSRSTPNFPNTIAFEKLMAPREDTLWRCLRK